jgi:hypothetical protein
MTVYSESVVAIVSVWLVWKYTKFFPRFDVFFKSILSAIGMGIFIYMFQQTNLNILYSIPLASIIYFILLYLLKGFTKKDINILLNKHEK